MAIYRGCLADQPPAYIAAQLWRAQVEDECEEEAS